MSTRIHPYAGTDIAIVIPTFNRPEKMTNILNSLISQTERCGRVVVVDGGESVKDIVNQFADRLPVEYHRCIPPGQIRQRNYGISLLGPESRLIASFDDDIVLEPNALKVMIDFLNHCEPDAAGVGFNMVNFPPHRFSFLKALFGMSSARQGQVLRSGFNVTIANPQKDFKSQWLCGGATIWKSEILKQHLNKEIDSRWAASEDLIFSYPIGKKYPLYVCADAKVRHEHVNDHKADNKYRYYGRTFTLWHLSFIEQHRELSRLRFFWMIIGQILGRLISGAVGRQRNQLYTALGLIDGMLDGIAALRNRTDLTALLIEDTCSHRQN